ncbi:mechanosensitive ion channel [Pseudomonas yamanorum]|uniref:Small-conductance mechanosensitive channel n=1 Tax=Pseudomonas yamanorum TaxID=515393 RepID=A0A7Y8FHA4_9PSED|nr:MULTISPECIES: mechanosensitive ion channel domain-containing protein [Pseudomonas]MCS3417305.1 small conductance mechanosensitive channel [Pseudomonas sp. BIGb0558]MCS3437266.1 small conductance mechanosensitive channel [Pseudomonas sp. BIGb0450]NVZ82705.1 mechanosensitive ion channel [Pseudomonas yamanorum]NWE14953.1 mechanosensitive ion channel [Pseudomonas yamanorum]NWE42372.1 mechanosensitive ion channel [Pseudomonas yamanorum]
MDLNAEVDHLIKTSESWLPMIMEYGSRFLLALVTLAIGWWLINVLTHRVGRLLALRNADLALQHFITSLANIALKVMLVVNVASMIGVATTSFVAAIGAATLAIGLALQGSLANFAGGVLILLFRPFRIGDWIEAQGTSGTVDSIQIFHTVLRTGDNKTVIIPNGSLSNGLITNTNRQPTRKVVFDVGVDYEADLQKAREVLLELAKDPRVLADPAPAAVVSTLGDSSITVSLRVWTKTSDYWDVMFMFNELARDRLKGAGIDIPFPQRVIRVMQESATK